MSKKAESLAVARSVERVAALVLGGGRGARLYPLTAERAKPAVPLCGRYRLVDIPLSNCIHSGVNNIFVLTQFNSASLHRHINETYKFDVFSGGFVEICAAEQTTESGDWFQGTADAVRKHLRHIRNRRPSFYLILSGDQLYRMDYRTLLETHLRHKADITVSTLPVTREAARAFGIMHVNPTGRITRFVEKPQSEAELSSLVTSPTLFKQFGLKVDEGRDYLASMGVYVFSADVLEETLEREKDWIDFGQHVIPKTLKTRTVCAHLFDGFWEDIGTVRSYYEVSLSMTAPMSPFDFHDANHTIYSRPRYLAGSRIQGGAIDDCIICEGSHVGKAKITKSIIGIRSVIHSGVTIDRSIVMGGDYYEGDPHAPLPAKGTSIPMGIGQNTVISGAIVDKNARIGKNVVIRGSQDLQDYSGDGFAIRDGIVIVLKGAVIPDGMHIG